MIAYLRNLGAGVSHLLNAVTGGDPRYSFSARVGWAKVRGKRWAKVAAAVIDRLLFSEDHCLEHAFEEGLISFQRYEAH